MVTKKEIKQSFFIALWFIVLTFPIMVIKVNTIKHTVLFRWNNILWVGIAGFFASLVWNYFLRVKEEKKNQRSMMTFHLYISYYKMTGSEDRLLPV